MFCILGADGCANLSIGAGETVSFAIPNVAVLDDPDIFEQRVSIYWFNGTNPMGLEWVFPMGPVIDGTVDLGTIFFDMLVRFELPYITPANYEPNDISWKYIYAVKLTKV